MAKKTQAPKSSVAIAPEVQISITQVQLTEVERLQTQIATSLGLAEAAVAGLRTIEESVSRLASSLRHLLKAQEHRSASSSRPHRPKPARRKSLVSMLQKLSRLDTRKPKGRVRKRVSRKQAGKSYWQPSYVNPESD